MGRGRNPFLRSVSHAHLPPCPPARHLCHCKITKSGWRRALCRADRTLSCMGRPGRDGRANRCGRRQGRRADKASIGTYATVDAGRTRGSGRTQDERRAGVTSVRYQRGAGLLAFSPSDLDRGGVSRNTLSPFAHAPTRISISGVTTAFVSHINGIEGDIRDCRVRNATASDSTFAPE